MLPLLLDIYSGLFLIIGNFRTLCDFQTLGALEFPWMSAKGFKHSLMLQIVGVTILSFYPDWMHCKSLGIDKPLLGSTLFVLVHHVLPGTLEANLSLVWREIQEIYEQLHTENRYGHMRHQGDSFHPCP